MKNLVKKLNVKITKEFIICIIIASIFVIIGTSTKTYIFEVLAIVMIVLGYLINLYSNQTRKEVTKNEQ